MKGKLERIPSKFIFVIIFFAMNLGIFSEPPQKPVVGTLLWSFVPPGRILGNPVPTPEGDWGFLCEDKYFYLLNSQGRVEKKWSVDQRFEPLLSRVSGEWALQTKDGNLWLLTKDLKARLKIKMPGPLAGPLTEDSQKNFRGATENGHVFSLHREGRILWTVDLRSPITTSPVIDAGGEFWVGTKNKHLNCFDSFGEKIYTPEIPSVLSSLALSPLTGLLGVGTQGQIFWFGDQGEVYRQQQFQGEKVQQIFIESSGKIWGIFLDKIRIFSPDSRLEKTYLLGAKIVGPGVLTNIGSAILPLSNGSISEWAPPAPRGKVLLAEEKPALSLGLSEDGVLLRCGENWLLSAFASPGTPQFGWSQIFGNSQGSSTVPRDRPTKVLARPYKDIPEYQYFKALVEQGDYASHALVLTELEKLSKKGELWPQRSFASLILLSIFQAGVTEPDFLNLRIVNNFPDLRRRAVALLAGSQDTGIRRAVALNLQQEYDPQARIGAIQVLGQLGFDGDGLSLRSIWKVLKPSDDEGEASAALGALKKIFWANGRLTDPVGLQILTKIYQGPFTSGLRKEAQKTLQSLVTGKI